MGLVKRQAKRKGFTAEEMAEACEIAARLTENPSLAAALREAAQRLKPKKRGRPKKTAS